MGFRERLMEKIWSRERDLRTKAWVFGCVALVSCGVSSFYSYNFLKRFFLTALLRNVPKKRLADVQEGEYVKVVGEITTVHPHEAGAGAAGEAATAKTVPVSATTQEEPGALKTPIAGVACVLLHALEYRVVEEMDRASGRFHRGKTKGKSNDRDTTGGGLEYTKDIWKEKHEVIKEVKRSVPCYLVEASTGAGMALDIGGNPLYLDLQTVHEEFKPIERIVEARSSRRTLGYKEVEKVLPLHAQLLVFAEVGRKGNEGDKGGELVLQRPTTKHMFDRKTARTKPYVITLLSETELLAKVERQARVELYIAGATALLSLLSGLLSRQSIALLSELVGGGRSEGGMGGAREYN